MKRLVMATLLTLLFSACKQETKSSRTIANLDGCPDSAWPMESLPLQLSIGSDLQDFLTLHYPNESKILESMGAIWSNEINATKGLINSSYTQETDPKHTLSQLYRTGNSQSESIGIYKSDTWFPEFGQSALAVTQYYVNGTTGKMTHADIFFNFKDYGQNFRKTSYGYAHYDIATVGLHELGHLLGACHYEPESSVMNPAYSGTRRLLYARDKNYIRAKYAQVTDYQSMNIASGNLNAIGVKRKASKAELENEIRAIVELKADGQCSHYIDGKLVQKHTVDLNNLK